MRLYLIAFQFLTIIPLPFSVHCEERDLGRAMALFPLVGLTIGALLAVADYVLGLRLPRPVVDLLLILILSALTGALHLDGLADVCDALAARGSRERFLEVMKDPRIGAVGVTGLVLALMLKYQALLQIPAEAKRPALLLFPLAARFSQVQMAVWAERARQDGLGATFIAAAGTWQFAVAGAMTGVFAWFLFGLQGILCCMLLYLCTWGLKAWFHRKLGGITGDIIGFVSELNEVLCLLIMLALLH
ncbi:MAG TPA: adenosylcobinamide-GDP ribazoletransferase [Geobacteraceae bacterium]|nr:adenosylcobinamide-GDP ribazoletransferase [Geobacteraceae bacterium]